MIRLLLAAALAHFSISAVAQVPPKPDIVLTGSVDGTDHQTYRELPFRVPAGVDAITVEFNYSGEADRTVIDLGLADPKRFRGASGGNKRRFTLSESYATPSYLPGPIIAGTWKLMLGIPNIRKASRSDYTAEISFQRSGSPARGLNATPLSSESRWYRGDFHAHSAHSDGNCASKAGKRVPCPLHKSIDAAAARGLDFVTMSEHNATSHHAVMVELQPYYDSLLLVPGRELTTFFGHANMFGPTEFVDFRVGSKSVPTVNAMLGRVKALGGLVAVNHPTAPSGEICMGCGWTAAGTDWSRVQAIEVVNGGLVAAFYGAVETPLSGIPFWEALLNKGHRLTAIGGSDNHDIERDANKIGWPSTVVFAPELSVAALLDAVRSGKAFVDIDGSRDRLVELSAKSGSESAEMGSELIAAAQSNIEFTVRVAGVADGRIEVIRDGRPVVVGIEQPIRGADETRGFKLVLADKASWVRVNVRAADGRLLIVGNPIYLRAER